jgi:integrase
MATPLERQNGFTATGEDKATHMRARITDEFIGKFPRPERGQVIVMDDLLPEFGVRFTPRITSFIAEPRTSEGKRVRETLAGARRWPQVLANEGRDLCRKHLVEVLGAAAQGDELPLRLAMRAWYERQIQLDVWRPRYADKVHQIITCYIEGEPGPRVTLTQAALAAISHLGKLPVAGVKRADLMRLVHAIKPATGGEVMAIISSFYGMMLEEGIECPNPARNRLKVTGGRRVRNRRLTDAEFLKLYRTIERDGDPATGAFLLLALTGCRRREITQLRWSEVDLDAATITLPPERRKTGKRDPEPFVIHLHPTAVALLRRQPVLEGNWHVFWGRRDKRPFDFPGSTLARLKAAGVQNVRLHDLRRYVRSGMAKLGITQMVAELCLGHSAKEGLVKVYDGHDYGPEQRAAWLKWGDYIVGLIGATT